MAEPLPPGKLELEHLAALLGTQPLPSSVVLGPGIGHDVAVIDVGGPKLLLLKSDPITFATRHLGHYVVQVNANDIACAGGTPRWFLATLLLPAGRATESVVEQLFTELREACLEEDVFLVGGHTEVTSGLDRPVVCGTMVGEVARDRLVTPAGIQAGDTIILTRPVALEGTATVAAARRADLLGMGLAPEVLDRCEALLFDPGIGVGRAARALCQAVEVHAMHDPTEGGVATALWELAIASGMAITLGPTGIPVLAETQVLCDHLGLDPLGLLASGSLLAAVAPGDTEAALAACRAAGVPCTPIAKAGPGPAGVWRSSPGGLEPLPRFDQDEITRAL